MKIAFCGLALFLCLMPVRAVAAEETVTFDQISEDPDNVALNYRYAQQQVARGNLRGAIAALDRLLFDNPNLHEARLFYALLLYRLDDLDDAARELDILDALPISASLRAQLDLYRKDILRRGKKTLWSGHLAVGDAYDTNRNYAPVSGQNLFLDAPVSLTGASAQRSDTSVIFTGDAAVRRDLGTQAGHELFGSVAYYRSDQTLLKTLDLQAVSLRGGATYKTSVFNVLPAAVYDYVTLSRAAYLRNMGGSLRFERNIRGRTHLYAEGRDVYQDYTPTPVASLAPQRNGLQLDGILGADYFVSPGIKVGASYTHAVKHAAHTIYSFDRDGVTVSGVWLPGAGMFLQCSLAANWDRYPHSDPFISSKYRHDSIRTFSAVYGIPLNLLWSPLRDFAWSLNYSYNQDVSNILNYAYKNITYSTMVTYRWEVGL